MALGLLLGNSDGAPLGLGEGIAVKDGEAVGKSLGRNDTVGASLATKDGEEEGSADGEASGLSVGTEVASQSFWASLQVSPALHGPVAAGAQVRAPVQISSPSQKTPLEHSSLLLHCVGDELGAGEVGEEDGALLAFADGSKLAVTEGSSDAVADGILLGVTEGSSVGCEEGDASGLVVGVMSGSI